MATETLEERSAHLRGVTVTAIASLSGVLAGLLSQTFAAGAGDPIALLVLVALIVVQFPLLQVTGIVEEFSKRDRLFVGFMTFSLWFVTWGVLLTTNAQLPF